MSERLLKEVLPMLKGYVLVGIDEMNSLAEEIEEYLKIQEPEPVAWQYTDPAGNIGYSTINRTGEPGWLSLYAHPTAQQEPVFLSDDAQYKLVNERYTIGGMDWSQAEKLVKDVEQAVLKANGIIK